MCFDLIILSKITCFRDKFTLRYDVIRAMCFILIILSKITCFRDKFTLSYDVIRAIHRHSIQFETYYKSVPTFVDISLDRMDGGITFFLLNCM